MADSPASQSAAKWIPPVAFYFQVNFQRMGGPNFRASFLEAGGLSWDLGKKVYRGNNGSFQAVPTGLTYPTNMTLKRPLGPMSGSLAKWLKECHDFISSARKDKDKKAVMTYDIVIHLMDKDGQPQASWQCINAYPMKWNLGNFASDKSEMAIETIELAYARLERVN